MYKLHLILKYLLKRRIAWVSLLAVMLCTTMVLVVISVMGGWLDMFKKSFRGLSGDLVIHGETLTGFAYYQDIIAAIEKDPACQVESAVPSIETAALFDYGYGPKPVRAIGLPIDEIDKVTTFHDSLYRQHTAIKEKLEDPTLHLSPEERKQLERTLADPPSFDLFDEGRTPLAQLPAGLAYAPPPQDGPPLRPGMIATPADFPKELRNRLRYDATRHFLLFRGTMDAEAKNQLYRLSADPAYRQAIDQLFTAKPPDEYFGRQGLPMKGRYDGMIVGVGVIGLRRDEKGKWPPRDDIEWTTPTELTLMDLSNRKVERGNTLKFYIVDDSHLGVWQYDSMCVYVPLDLLQHELGLSEVKQDDLFVPGRVTDIHVKVKQGIDPNDENTLKKIQAHIEVVVAGVLAAKRQTDANFHDRRVPEVETWQDVNRLWISAVENEKLLMVILFGIMCLVAIFLIFCIFYMIVVEKTRDIGIIKSVGATSAGVAGIFLGYGLVIGILGSGMGLLLSYLIIHNINEMHQWLGEQFHVKIWDPQVYVFDKIPNVMNGSDIAWIIPTAVLASVMGALIPAIRAGRLNPVDSLRWE